MTGWRSAFSHYRDVASAASVDGSNRIDAYDCIGTRCREAGMFWWRALEYSTARTHNMHYATQD